jgi:hypothetical protein
MWLYRSWDGSYYVTNNYDGGVGLVRKISGFKGMYYIAKYVGLKAVWLAGSLRSTDKLIVIG